MALNKYYDWVPIIPNKYSVGVKIIIHLLISEIIVSKSDSQLYSTQVDPFCTHPREVWEDLSFFLAAPPPATDMCHHLQYKHSDTENTPVIHVSQAVSPNPFILPVATLTLHWFGCSRKIARNCQFFSYICWTGERVSLALVTVIVCNDDFDAGGGVKELGYLIFFNLP